jgi:hypothetical protein
MACASPPFSPTLRPQSMPSPCSGPTLGSAMARSSFSRTPERAHWDAATARSRSGCATASTGMADPACCRAPIRQSRLQHRRADSQCADQGTCLFPPTDPTPPSAAVHGGLDPAVLHGSEPEQLAAATNVQCAALNGSFWSYLALASRRAAAPAEPDQAREPENGCADERTPARELRPRRGSEGDAECAAGWRVLLDEAMGGKRSAPNHGRVTAEETARAKRSRPTLPR